MTLDSSLCSEDREGDVEDDSFARFSKKVRKKEQNKKLCEKELLKYQKSWDEERLLKVESLLNKLFKSASRKCLECDFVVAKLSSAGCLRSKLQEDVQKLVDQRKFLFYKSYIKKLC